MTLRIDLPPLVEGAYRKMAEQHGSTVQVALAGALYAGAVVGFPDLETALNSDPDPITVTILYREGGR